MKIQKQKREKDRQTYDTKERHQRILNAKNKVEEADNLLHKVKDIYDETEKERMNERILDKLRSAISEVYINKTRNQRSRQIHRRNILSMWNSQHKSRKLPKSHP